MGQYISYKTELNEIITLEEISMLFDNIAKRYSLSLVALSLYPDFLQLKEDIISTTTKRKNYEISCLLNEIAERKQDIKTEMWEHLNKLGIIKKELEVNPNKEDLEQAIFEEEEIIDAYEEIICSLEKKEKKIMSGKYSRINKMPTLSKEKSLKRQLEDLAKTILDISDRHNDCFDKYQERLENLIEKSVITTQHIVDVLKTKDKIKIDMPNNVVSIFENIGDIKTEITYDELTEFVKDFYLYEPNKEISEDELIYQLLSNINYNEKDGSINAIEMTSDIDD